MRTYDDGLGSPDNILNKEIPMELIKNYLVSAIRTAVPFAVGQIAQLAATRGINIDTPTLHLLTALIGGIAGIGYYLVVRALEHINHRFGWLLGYAKMPDYSPGGALPQPPHDSGIIGK